jgi:hypothetical protein
VSRSVDLAGGSGADCLTVTVCPAIVAERDCALLVVFVETVRVTVPFPPPAVGEIETTESFVVAVHAEGEHPTGAAVTVTTCELALALMLIVAGETVNAQPTLTFTCWRPATPSNVATTSAVPIATAVMTPPVTVTFVESEDVH